MYGRDLAWQSRVSVSRDNITCQGLPRSSTFWHKSRFYTIFVIGKVCAKINIYLINAKLSQALNVRDLNRPSLWWIQISVRILSANMKFGGALLSYCCLPKIKNVHFFLYLFIALSCKYIFSLEWHQLNAVVGKMRISKGNISEPHLKDFVWHIA